MRVVVGTLVAGMLAIVIASSALPGGSASMSSGPAPLVRHGSAALPMGARAMVARALGDADRGFFVRRVRGGMGVLDARTGISAHFRRGGAAVRVGGRWWALGLRAIGRGDRLIEVSRASPRTRANRVWYARPGVEEWYADGPLGLEQGFTLGRRPAGGPGHGVVLELGDLPRGVRPIIAADERRVSLERGRHEVMRYWGLVASDARGRRLPARIVVAGSSLSLQVDDRRARYPLTVDPFVQAAKLTPSDGGSEFGTAIAISGDTIVAGLPFATIGNNSSQGAVYVFAKPGGGWASAHELAKLTVPDGATDDGLGSSVAISGDGTTILAGAPGADNQQGAAYVFTKQNGAWVQVAKLTRSAGASGDRFGFSVALSDDTAVAGVPFEGNGQRANDGGSVYAFAKPGAGWTDSGTPTARLTGSDATGVAALGYSVGIDGDTIVAGAEHEDIGNVAEQGALYVFVKPANGWANANETKKLTASDGPSANQLGYSVAIAGDVIVAGAPFPRGAAYVFVRPANGWASANGNETAKLTPSDPNNGFAESVAISDGTIVAGAPSVAVGPNANQGKLYVFSKPADGWASEHEAQQLTASDGAQRDQLGFASGVSGGTVAGGAPLASQGTGAVYVFTSGAQAATTTGVRCQPATVAVGSASSCTATVTDAGGTTPTGSVAFTSDSAGTFGAGGSCALVPTGNAGEGSCHVDYTPSAVGSGTHTITGAYGGDAGHGASRGNGSVTVTGGGGNGGGGGAGNRPTRMLVSCSPSDAAVGNAVTCTAVVADNGAGLGPTPTGTVSFTTDSHGSFGNPGAACRLTEAQPGFGTCSVDYTPAAVDSGTHSVTGAYSGDGVYSASRASTAVTVFAAKRPTAASVSCSPTPVTVAQTTSCAVVVTDGGPGPGVTPTGSVAFTTDSHGTFSNPGATCRLDGFGRCAVDYSPAVFDSGSHAITASYSGDSAHTASSGRGIAAVLQPAPVDVIVTGIEVTQAVQAGGCNGCVGTLPSRSQNNPNATGQATYQGVLLAAQKYAVVRVFAHVFAGASFVTGATARLEVLDSLGRRVDSLSPGSSPISLKQAALGLNRLRGAGGCLCVSLDERADPGTSFNFLVPAQDTNHRSVTFRATVTPPVGPGVQGQCAGCGGNVFTLNSVPFVNTASVDVYPIPLSLNGVRTKQSESQVLGDTQTLLPDQLVIHPYDRPLSVDPRVLGLPVPGLPGSLTNTQAAAAVALRASDDHLSNGDYPIGAFFLGEGNLKNGLTSGMLWLGNGPSSIVLDSGRPVTSVSHEIGHGFGLVHADTGGPVPFPLPFGRTLTQYIGPHPDGTPDCGGNSGGQVGESWPPDDEGRLQSVGLDRRSWDVGKPASALRTFVEGYDNSGISAPGTRHYDFMSYCPSGGVTDSNDWISVRNWSRLITTHPFLQPPRPLPPATDRSGHAAGSAPVRVIATIEANRAASIFDVAPGQRTDGGPTSGSPYQFELRDAAGKPLTSVVPTTTSIHVDQQAPGVLLTATLPYVPGAASVALMAGGQQLATRTRSAHAPTGTLLAPSPRSIVGRARSTLVRWRADDGDGDRMVTTIDYSADGGRHWKVVADALTGRSARVPSRYLSGSRDGRLRLRISDGFNVTTLTSGRLRAVGAPPVVQILGMPHRLRVPATATLPLEGSAFDDAGKVLGGHHLTWYLGKRIIGHGEFATARRLSPGNPTIRLVARDARGRTSQALLRLRVSAVAARYMVFNAPLRVSRRARSIRLTVTASAPATFTVAGKRYRVGLRPRTIKVAIRPGRPAIRLACSLRSAGGVIRGTYVAVRGQ